MAFTLRRAEYLSPSPKESTVQFKQPHLLGNVPRTPLSSRSPPMYEVEQTSFVDTTEKGATVGSPEKGSWARDWDEAVKVGRWPRIIYATVGTFFMGFWLIVTFQFDQFELNYQTANMDNVRERVFPPSTQDPVRGSFQCRCLSGAHRIFRYIGHYKVA